MNLIDRQGIVHSDPLHVQRPNPDTQNVTPNGDAIPGASSWSLTQIIDGLATNLGEAPGTPEDADIDAAIDGSLPALRAWAAQHAPAHAHDPDHDIPRRVTGRDLAYASIARRVLDNHAIQPHFRRDGEQIEVLLAEAARLGYEMGYGAR